MASNDVRHTPTPRLVAELDALLEERSRATTQWLCDEINRAEYQQRCNAVAPRIAALRHEIARRNTRERP